MADIPSHDVKRVAAQHADVIQKVAQALARLNVAPLPRHYELFFEGLSGQNPALTRALAALGNRPAPAQLEQIGIAHNLPGYAALAADRARAAAAFSIGGLQVPLKDGMARREVFTTQLQSFLDRLAADPVTKLSDFADDAAVLREAAGRLHREEQRFTGLIQEALCDLQGIEAGIEADRKALARDPVTALPNKIAFSAKLSSLFQDRQEVGAAALMMVVVEGLRGLGDSHGATAAEKALRKLGAVFRKSIKKNDFVARVGPDEFAFVFNDLNADNAQIVADRIRTSVEAIEFSVPSRVFPAKTLSISAGIAITATAESASDLFTQAELALRAAHAGEKPATLVFSLAIGGKVEKTYSHSAA